MQRFRLRPSFISELLGVGDGARIIHPSTFYPSDKRAGSPVPSILQFAMLLKIDIVTVFYEIILLNEGSMCNLGEACL